MLKVTFLFLAIGLSGFLCSAILITVIHRSFLRWIGGVSEWAWACGLMIVASLLFGDGVSRSIGSVRLLANIAFFAAVLMMYVSLRKFAGVAPAYRALSGVIGVITLLLAWFTFIHDDYPIRAMCVVTAHLILFSACAATIRRMKHPGFPERFTLCVFLLLAGISLIRFLSLASGYEQSDILQDASRYQTGYLLVFASCTVALVIGYMLLVGIRLRDALRRLASFGAFDTTGHNEKFELERDLSEAAKKAQLVLHYQPRVSVKTGEILGVEALLRWQHPTRGLLLPNQFIPISEETDMILSIGEWVLDESARMLNRLCSDGNPGINMSINVSARQIENAALPTQIARLLKNVKFKAHQIELELTESSVINDRGGARQVMAQLKSMGVRLSVDDFGTGYSSLAYIKNWPIDCVKIDRSFVSDIPRDPGDVAITHAIIAMGHALGLSVVAEGVENSEQLAYLRDAGCDEYQGYLASEPVPEPELFSLLASWSPQKAANRLDANKNDRQDAVTV